ncbi:hypothetical protein, partial [Bacteroides hominis]
NPDFLGFIPPFFYRREAGGLFQCPRLSWAPFLVNPPYYLHKYGLFYSSCSKAGLSGKEYLRFTLKNAKPE